MPIAILLVDEHRLCRQGVRALLEAEEGMEVVGEAGDGRLAINLAQAKNPDVVLIEIGLPGLNGVEATARIREACPDVKVVALSGQSDPGAVTAMLLSGASGFVLKQAGREDLISAIHSAVNGQTYLSPQIAGVVVDDLLRRSPRGVRAAAGLLTAREREVLQLLAEGHTSREIGGLLDISSRTVDTHRRRIMKKLQIRNLAGLVKFAVREGLTSPD
ncbi:MAG: response regulator transcription factor [Proteobacteria bacterium]|nr:response regulator transcription factor [Pseudomonadota bacterium]MBU1741361.1 response regulator transcription factor [Pseudomonadota bacterium]